MDTPAFEKMYFTVLMKKFKDFGLRCDTDEDKKKLYAALMTGIGAMVNNDGSCTNEERFFATFEKMTGSDFSSKKDELDQFYQNEFNQVAAACKTNPRVAEIISLIKERGIRVAIATNPLFPLRANESRLKWAGLSLNEFEYCTCYENSGFCKPNLEYYRAILKHLNLKPEDCLMVGNDVREDMVARELGMDVFLITDCLLNIESKDISQYPNGSWDDFKKYMGV